MTDQAFYKQDHPKVEPIKKKKKKASRPKYSLPKEVRTREDMQKDAHDYMETPSKTTHRFRSTKFPTSIQRLTDFEQTKKNHALIEEIATRLEKDATDYLLFEDDVVDDYLVYKEYSVEELLQKSKQKTVAEPVDEPEPKHKPEPKEKPKSNALVIQEKMASNLHKPNSGLHRSLSKIIAEDQEALKNRKNNLGSLFSEDR